MSATTTLRMILLGEDKSAGKTLKNVGDEADKSGKKMQTFHKVGTAAGVALAGGLALAGKAAFDMTKAAAEDQQGASRLAQTLDKTTGATKKQTDAVESWITAQGKAKGFSDDELRPALSQLAAATGSIAKSQKLAGLAMDIATAKGIPLATVSKALAKAAIGQTSGLSKLGVQTTKTTGDTLGLQRAQTTVKSAQLAYTAAVKAHGKASTEASIAADKLKQAHEGVARAQAKTTKTSLSLKDITGNLSDLYGGAAAKNAQTAAGKQKIMQVQMQELKEQIGMGLIPVMSKLMTIGLGIVNWISNNTKVAGVLVGVIGGLLAVTWAVSTATKVWFAITKLQTAAQIVMTNAQWALNAAMDANPIGLVVIAVALLVAGLVIAYKKSETFRNIVNGAFGAVKTVVLGALSAIKNAVVKVISFIVAHWKIFAVALATILLGPLAGLVVLVVTHLAQIKAAFVKAWTAIKAGVSAAWHAITGLAKSGAQDLLGVVKGIPGAIRGLAGLYLSAGKFLITSLFRGLVVAAKAGAGFATDLVGAIKNAINAGLHLPLQVNFDKGPLHIHTTVIPALAKGGIVTRPTMALIGEAGPEAVVPLSRGGAGGFGGGDTVNITVMVAPNADLRAIGKATVQAVNNYYRTSGKTAALLPS